MRYALSVLLLICMILLPFAVQAIEKPIVYLSFDNVKGDAVDDLSGFENHGTMQDNPETVDGQFGEALEFSGSRVRIAASESMTPELFAEGDFTLVLWVSTSLSGNAWQQVFRAGPEPNDTLFLNIDGTLSWRGWVGGGWAGGMCETVPGVVEVDTWTHVAVVSDTKNFRVYVNGELSKESPFQETRGNNQEFMIGGYAGGESYTGAVDDFAVFNVPLREAEINSIMQKGIALGTAVDSKGKMAATWAVLKSSL